MSTIQMKLMFFCLLVMPNLTYGKVAEDQWTSKKMTTDEGFYSGFLTEKGSFRLDSDGNEFQTKTRMSWIDGSNETISREQIEDICSVGQTDATKEVSVLAAVAFNPLYAYEKLKMTSDIPIADQGLHLRDIHLNVLSPGSVRVVDLSLPSLMAIENQIRNQIKNYAAGNTLRIDLSRELNLACAIEMKGVRLKLQFEYELDAAKRKRVVFLEKNFLINLSQNVLGARRNLSTPMENLIANSMVLAETYRQMKGDSILSLQVDKQMSLATGLLDQKSGQPFNHTVGTISELADKLDSFVSYRTTGRMNLVISAKEY